MDFFSWIEEFKVFFHEQPIVGAVIALATLALALWLFKKAIKVFLFLCLALVVLILASYFFYDETKTEKVVRRGASEAADVLEEAGEYAEQELERAAQDIAEKRANEELNR